MTSKNVKHFRRKKRLSYFEEVEFLGDLTLLLEQRWLDCCSTFSLRLCALASTTEYTPAKFPTFSYALRCLTLLVIPC